MARHAFGGDVSAWVFAIGAGDVATLASAVPITFWSERTGGIQFTDLAAGADGSGAMSQVESGDGTDIPVGDVPLFYGPDGVLAMWAEANGQQPRKLMIAHDVLPLVLTIGDDQVVTGTKTFNTGNVNRTAIVLQAASTGQVADLLSAWSGIDTGQGAERQRTFYLNEKGELRVIAAKANSVAVRIKGQPLQTAHVLEQTDTGNIAVSWWEPNGSWRAPNLGHVFSMSVSGNLAAGVGQHRIYNDTGVPLVIRAVRASVGTPPIGSVARVDINRNGVSIFTTQANRPTIAAGASTSGKVTNADVTALADGDYLTVDVDNIGSTSPGADLVVQILAY